METDYKELVGEYFESRHGMPWYRASDMFPSRFVDKGTIVEVLEILPDDWIRFKFEESGEVVKTSIKEFEAHFDRV